jgi:hypothetical protein
LHVYYVILYNSPWPWTIVDQVLKCLNLVTLSVVTAWLVRTSDYKNHWHLVNISYGLSGVLVMDYAIKLSLNYVQSAPSQDLRSWPVFVVLTLVLIMNIITGTIPRGPRLYLDLRRMYNLAVSQQLERNPQPVNPNVVETSSCSILGAFTLSFVYTIMSKTMAMEQVDIQDLDVVESHLRTQNIVMQVSNQVYQPKEGSHPTWYLLYTIWAPEWRVMVKSGFIVIHLADDVAALLMFSMVPLWYIPHICLQQILWHLDEGTKDQTFVIAYSVLLVISKLGVSTANLTLLNM